MRRFRVVKMYSIHDVQFLFDPRIIQVIDDNGKTVLEGNHRDVAGFFSGVHWAGIQYEITEEKVNLTW